MLKMQTMPKTLPRNTGALTTNSNAMPATIAARQALAAYDVSSPKRATNVTVNADLLAQARQCGVNLSQTLEDALKARLGEERRRKWLEDNREAIEDYNKHFEKYGLWSDGLRMF